MISYKKWGCPNPDCKQESSRHWNMEVHIKRAHGIGEPIEHLKSEHEVTHGYPRSSNANNYSFNPGVAGTNSPGSTRAPTNRVPKTKVGPFSDIINQRYQIAL